MRIAHSHKNPLTLLLALALAAALVLLTAVDAEAGKRQGKKGSKGKDKNKPAAAAATEQPAAAATGLAAPAAPVTTAERHLLAYRTDAAKSALESAAGDDAWAVAARGWVLQQEKDFAAAAAESRRAADLDPRNPVPMLRLGETLTLAEKSGAREAYAEAEKRARALLAANPTDVDGLVCLGIAQQRLQRLEESAATLGKASEAAPGDPLVRFHLGATRFYQEKWQQAFDEMSAALDANPEIALAYYYRGLAAGKLDRKDLLYNDLDRFVRMAPDAPEADYARRLLSAFG